MDSPDQSFSNRRKNAILAYPGHWQRLLADWRAEGDDAAWLIYAANYLFRTAGMRWVMDPITLWARLRMKVPVNLVADLAGLDFLVLTHRHADHYDARLLEALAILPILWVVPEFMLADLHRDVSAVALSAVGNSLSIPGSLIWTGFVFSTTQSVGSTCTGSTFF
jgi:L-ascorbate metabolism protein UlaG (beta-lactamase superfamily)